MDNLWIIYGWSMDIFDVPFGNDWLVTNIGGCEMLWHSITGWLVGCSWNMTFIFPYELGITVPTDFHIFQRVWNHQPDKWWDTPLINPINWCRILPPSTDIVGSSFLHVFFPSQGRVAVHLRVRPWATNAQWTQHRWTDAWRSGKSRGAPPGME